MAMVETVAVPKLTCHGRMAPHNNVKITVKMVTVNNKIGLPIA